MYAKCNSSEQIAHDFYRYVWASNYLHNPPIS